MCRVSVVQSATMKVTTEISFQEIFLLKESTQLGKFFQYKNFPNIIKVNF